MLAFAARTVVSAAESPTWRALDEAGGLGQPRSCARTGKQARRLLRRHPGSRCPARPAAAGVESQVGLPLLAEEETEAQGQRPDEAHVL